MNCVVAVKHPLHNHLLESINVSKTDESLCAICNLGFLREEAYEKLKIVCSIAGCKEFSGICGICFIKNSHALKSVGSTFRRAQSEPSNHVAFDLVVNSEEVISAAEENQAVELIRTNVTNYEIEFDSIDLSSSSASPVYYHPGTIKINFAINYILIYYYPIKYPQIVTNSEN